MTPIRQELLSILAELSGACPEMRFGQLIANLSYLAVEPTVEAIWDMEDENLLEAIRQHLADLSMRKSEVA